MKIDKDKLQKEIKDTMDRQSRMNRAIWFSGTPVVEKKRNKFAVKGTPKVSIEATGCAVSVRGWDKSEVEYVVTELSGRRSSPALVTDVHDSNSVTLKIVNNTPSFSPGIESDAERVRIEIFVPRKSNLKIVTDGEIRLDGVSGEIELKGDDESINIRDVDGTMNLLADEAQVRVIGFKGNLISQTACGDVFLEGDFKNLSAKATDGTVTLTLPKDTNATVTSNTEVESDGVTVVRENEHTWRVGKGGTKYNFDFNEGKLVVRSTASVTSY